MRTRRRYAPIIVGALIAVVGAGLVATAEGQRRLAADVVVLNGRIVTVDDASFTSRLGTTAEAMAIKDGKIVALGTNEEVLDQVQRPRRARIWDLGGRTVVPGLISVHEHPYDWGPVSPAILERVLSDDDVVVRVMDDSPQENLANFRRTLRDAVSAAEPGQWIYIVLTFGRNYQWEVGGNGGHGNPANEDLLDGQHEPLTFEGLTELAPDNPVLVRDVFVRKQLNQRAWEEAKEVFPVGDNPNADFANGPSGIRWLFPDVVMRDRYALLREIQRLSLSYWSGYGFTAFGSHAYTPSNLTVYDDLVRSGQMDLRTQWSWWWRNSKHFDDEFFRVTLARQQGKATDPEATDMLWFGGAQASNSPGSGCTTLRPDDRCTWAPGSENAQLLYDWIKSGGRFTTTHTVGDEDLDYAMDIIERASRDAGFSLQEIREKRHSFDHNMMNPRPDQIPRMKRLGIITGGDSFEIWQSAPTVKDELGDEAVSWVVPKRSLVNNEIPNAFEIDRTLPATDLTAFWSLSLFITRAGWDGEAYAPEQAVNRRLALKMATTWGAYYLKKEDVIGSLEVGKYADFAVLDRDYLTIPQRDIKDIKVLMTVMDGEPRHLTRDLAREIGESPVGAQVELGVTLPDEVGPPQTARTAGRRG
jgi:predicted amidohydrolase YtcJ